MSTKMRGEPQPSADGPGALLAQYLAWYRETAIAKVASLPAQERRRPVLPSGWTPLELLFHLACMERRWFVWGFLGEPVADAWRDATDDGGWVTLELDVDELRALLTDAAARTREIVEAHPLTDVARVGGRFTDQAVAPQLQWILLHLLQEYARHTGHLDIARELVDGSTGEEG
jgi:uncharacterized damage-inducible protein DinB